ncbi:MAG: Gliding motility-associated ABC transporter permease protein GldF [Cytophagales bacterium]|jgi:ABC-2 type transport system permease protein|nr:ABC transporter permease subunit [Bacteroidota bacterium]MBS1980846.1 ABC transporter permease subunit [Bacteroidota bacterium]WHZ08193.1 MAG: Gliding motility-associated ABC transporter permease protein GldF [Cytophagales bacterium]
MYAVWILTKRELQSFFDSLIAYILLALFLGFSGFFTWMFGSDIFLTGQVSLRGFFGIAYWTLFFFAPAITMRLLAEERKTGTIEWLLTKPVTDRQVVLGKFLAAVGLVAIALLFTLPYVITLANIGNLDLGSVVCGYLGLLLISASYISIGLYASSTTNNQIVAFLLALFIGLFFHIIFGVIADNTSGFIAQVFTMLSLSDHFESISRGVIDSRDILYFLSVICIGLILSELSLTKRSLN